MTKLKNIVTTKTKKTIVLYSRVSRAGKRKAVADTLANDISLEAQLAAGRRYAEQNNLEIIGEFKECQSGRKLSNRPLFAQALKLCKKHSAVLHVWSLSRAFRSVKSALEISEQLKK